MLTSIAKHQLPRSNIEYISKLFLLFAVLSFTPKPVTRILLFNNQPTNQRQNIRQPQDGDAGKTNDVLSESTQFLAFLMTLKHSFHLPFPTLQSPLESGYHFSTIFLPSFSSRRLAVVSLFLLLLLLPLLIKFPQPPHLVYASLRFHVWSLILRSFTS